MSRLSNSEKYIVCLGYKGYNKDIIKLLCHSFKETKIDISVSNQFMNDIYEYNKLYCENQINHIKKGIHLIKTNQLNNKPTSEQLTLGVDWCKKYDIPINHKCSYLI